MSGLGTTRYESFTFGVFKEKRRLIVLKGVDVVLNLFYFLFLFNLNNSYWEVNIMEIQWFNSGWTLLWWQD